MPDTPETASAWRRALGSVAVDLGLLRRRRDFGLLVLGQTVSELGSMATFVAIPFQAYDLTGSSLAVGLLGVAEFAPIIVLALVGGALADAFDRRRLVQIAEVGAAIVAGALLVNATLPDPHLWVLYVCSALLAAFTAMRRPPLDALILAWSRATSSRPPRRCSSAFTTWPRSRVPRSPACSSRRPA